ncbi:MAG: EAL domain-containing protein, partial [Devosia sp.]
KAFVAGISNGAIGTAVIDHIIELGTERGLKVIAEGVEQDEQRRALVSRGVAFGQGWLFGKPVAALAFATAYAENRAAQSEVRPLARIA